MDFIFTGLFWGVILILIGLSVILRTFFHIHIPFFRILVALFFIFLGIKVLTGFNKPIRPDKGTTVFGDTRVPGPDQKEYSTIFGRSEIVLKQDSPVREVNSIFAETVLRVPSGVAAKIVCDAVFSGARFPDGTVISFGSYTWKSEGLDESKPHIVVRASSVFGGLAVIRD
jgi:hypothetical protein